jgi:quercetin dioxygenase-like cupin family protein
VALAHTAPGKIIDVRARTGPLRPADSETLVRTDHLEIFRYALPAGKVVDTHTAAGLMVVQCLEGTVEFTSLGKTQKLTPGTMLYLPDHAPHALRALSDAQLLITILLHRA